jgi:hypothetical protein
MGRYSDTNVEKSGILLIKIEKNGGFLVIIFSQGMIVRIKQDKTRNLG